MSTRECKFLRHALAAPRTRSDRLCSSFRGAYDRFENSLSRLAQRHAGSPGRNCGGCASHPHHRGLRHCSMKAARARRHPRLRRGPRRDAATRCCLATSRTRRGERVSWRRRERSVRTVQGHRRSGRQGRDRRPCPPPRYALAGASSGVVAFRGHGALQACARAGRARGCGTSDRRRCGFLVTRSRANRTSQ